jgi:1-acyl-sn-glycerol-3-phosphate acyltransferase
MSDRANRDYSPAVRRATTLTFPPLIRAVMKRDWHGQEHIPRAGPVIVAANHLSYADWAAVALFTYQAGRYPAFLIKSSAFNVKVVGPFLHAAGQFSVNRGASDAALVLKDAERALDQGECLIFYPEGTATRDPALWPMVPKTGVARLALATGVPVIPVAHWGAQVILPYGTKKPRLLPRHLVRMLAGPPVDLSAFAGQPMSREVLRDAAAAIMADITGLLARLRGEAPPAHPYDPVAARRASRKATGQILTNDNGGRDPGDDGTRDPLPGTADGQDAAGRGTPGDAAEGGGPRKATPA